MAKPVQDTGARIMAQSLPQGHLGPEGNKGHRGLDSAAILWRGVLRTVGAFSPPWSGGGCQEGFLGPRGEVWVE